MAAKKRSPGCRPGATRRSSLSPDGQRAVLGVSAVPDLGLSVVDLERLTVSRLTFESMAVNPVWTPDGTRVAYSGLAAGESVPNTFWKRSDGSGGAEPLLATEEGSSPSDFSSDGRQLVFVQRDAGPKAVWQPAHMARSGRRDSGRAATPWSWSARLELDPGRHLARRPVDRLRLDPRPAT